MSRILCALSGGVDSSVAAQLLLDAGHEVIGVFMRNGVSGEHAAKAKSCCSASDARDARRTAERLGIPFYAVDFAEEFESLIARFVDEYRAGRTPSPCVLCNSELKFGHLFELAESLGAEGVATGHYARCHDGVLSRPLDRAKDQTYFLFGVDRGRLGQLHFPLADLSKGEVRAIAEQHGLATAHKPESMEICFVPTGDYRDVLRERGALSPGRFVDLEGRELGRHEGFEAFTVGQRRGLPALGSPRYVVELRPEAREVVLAERDALAVGSCVVESVNWLCDVTSSFDCAVQIRARHRAARSRLRVDGPRVYVDFDDAQEAVTPGQAAVFYDGDRVLGGGWIATPSAQV